MRAVVILASAIVLLFIGIPLAMLVGLQKPNDLLAAATDPSVERSLALSLASAATTAGLAGLFGVPLAYGLARYRFPGKPFVAAVVDLPLAVPHTVAGIALLFAFGRTGIIGAPVEAMSGLRFWGTTAGIVVAMLFVSLPYTVNAARLSFESIDPNLEYAALTSGIGLLRTFVYITLPLSWRGICSGMTLSFARAISEFGAVVILAYFPMTAPVKIYDLYLQSGLRPSSAAAVLLLLVVLVLFVLLRWIAKAGSRPN